MKSKEREYYDNLKNDKSLNENGLKELLEDASKELIPLINNSLMINGRIPIITNVVKRNNLSAMQIPDMESSNLFDAYTSLKMSSNLINKKIITLPLDINKRGDFSDAFYIQRGLHKSGYGSAGLTDLSPEDLNKIVNDEALPFYVDAVLKQNKTEVEEHYAKRWLTNNLYNSADYVMHFIYSKEQNGTMMMKMNLVTYNLLKSSSKSYIHTISKDIRTLLDKNSEYNFSTDQIASVIETELISQTQDQENKYDPTIKAFQVNGITEAYYQNKCDDGTLVTVHIYLNRNTLVYSYSSLEDAKKNTKLELINEPFVVFKKNGIWERSELLIDFSYNNGQLPTSENMSFEEKKDISEKLLPFLKISSLKGNEKQMALLDKKMKKLLSNKFYSDVKLAVSIKSYPDDYKFIVANSFEDIQKIKTQNDRITTYSYQNIEGTPDITIDITLDEKGKPIIKNIVNPLYLKEFEDKWKTEAKKRGLDADIPSLREQVKTDLENLAKETDELSFYKKFVQKTKALLSDNIADYVEAIASTQKIAKNIWKEGTVNESTWHTKGEEHKQWPKYCQFEPTIAGVEDGVIDEVVGIPMAIKGVYEIVIDDEKQKALMGMFTKEGMVNLYEGLQEEVKDTYNDPEKGKHFVGQTTVSVVSMMSGVGLLTKAKKIDDIVELGTDLEKVIPDAKTTKFLDDFKKGERHVDNDKIFRELKEQIDEDLFDDVVKDGSEEIIAKGKKLSFRELQAFWKRGNDFNAKSKELKWYENNEIWMTHPEKVYPKGHKNAGKPRRYRLDSWDKDGNGMILSRKATNLSEINKDTFIKYCKEIKEKYPPGSKIANSEIGDKLYGKYCLEIPDTNLKFDKIDEYKKIAKDLGVELIFKPE
ncbi:hypothetical protein J2X31_003491 [Flavobacterium arsenatis]|uniref:Uncharacterized protein n=1 Tax=Flavobacterium arsenatis TaxID=1484332 RepID=A0ABU1TUD6_9FLAO|nr:hypothetical protein [Flavobacterium arsenatis]MDR6969460.1 hypothetical protein [Flavobacterium arsenatis]